METTKKCSSKWTCQKAKEVVNSSNAIFMDFAATCFDCKEFLKAIEVLLPFDRVAQAKLKIDDDASPVASVGLSVMRMDFQPSLFMLGISMEIAEGVKNTAVNSTFFVTAGKTLGQMREYVRSESFSTQAKENFEKQIELSFSSQDRNT